MAKSSNYIYVDEQKLQRFLEEEGFNLYSNVLVHIFSGEISVDLITSITTIVREHLPQAVIAGCTTNGAVADGSMCEDEILLSFTVFERTEVNSVILQGKDFSNSKEMGKAIVNRVGRTDSKLLFLFTAGVNIKVPNLIQGIIDERKDIVIAGGVANHNQPIVFTTDEIVEDGVVAIALSNKDLIVTAYQDHKWSLVGNSLTISKAKDNIIYGINGKKPNQLLKKYLGDYFIKDLPNTGSEFPFILENEYEKRIVFVNRIFRNGAIEMSHPIKDGDLLTLSYVDVQKTISRSERMIKRMAKQPVESIFIFHDFSRKRLLRNFTKQELEMLQTIGCHSGFISNGHLSTLYDDEVASSGNVASIVTLAESFHVEDREDVLRSFTITNELKSLMVLEHLMQATTKEIKALNEELVVSEQYFKSLFENNTDFVYSTDLDGNITHVNESFTKIFQYPLQDVIGYSISKFVDIEERAQVKIFFNKAMKGKMQYYELPLRLKNGKLEHFQVKNIPIIVHGQIVGIHAVGRNISEQMRIEEQLLKLAYYNGHTGLPNRVKFTDLLVEHIERSNKKKRELSVVIIDIDRFKHINDSIGHYSGDLVIKEIAERIKSVTPPGTYIGHLAGDKFTLILTKNVSIKEVRRVVQEVEDSIGRPIVHNNQEFYVTSSIGISMYPSDGMDASRLMKHADIAMNRVKAMGGNNVLFFNMKMIEEAKQRTELESSLRRAIRNQEFFLCYQPLLDLQSEKLYGSEALIRWMHPTNGIVPPNEFIPLAEETGLIKEIGLWVLQTACKQNKEWQDKGLGNLVISVNVSAHQFQQPQFVQQVKDALVAANLEPKYLRLELTESVMVQNMNHSIAIMNEIQNLGVKISIDDFGTGYSSLSYLKNFPIDYLKIDRSFINNLQEDNCDNAIVKAIITMGHGLSLKIVAEGVETEAQMSLLKIMKCHFVQGYYINRPLIPEDFEKQAKERIFIN
ncbi:EAL domain-containing protein [Bacillus massiliigorillae]|uniref:EAL domain-containing protein n=1 Tax=Bacillus massiliigorillae TaxID=1243664 RepID=UPI0003A55BFC|nr:EAL domain-containing protein [Bacillus massiliigorillae]